MFRVLIDSDLLLDYFASRNNFFEGLMEMKKYGQIKVYVIDLCLDKIHSYTNKKSEEYANKVIKYLEKQLKGCVITVTNKFQKEASKLPLPDFESAIEIICARDKQLDAIVTHNYQNFDGDDFPLWSTENLPSRSHLEKCLHSFQSKSDYLTDSDKPDCHPLEALGTMKYRVRNSINTVMDVFRLCVINYVELFSGKKFTS